MTHPDDRQHHAALQRIPYDRVAWDAIVASREDAEVYHTAAWLEFLAATQGAEPVTAVVSIDGRPVGYFLGAIVRRLGVRVLGSPLRGWGTECMGFLLDDGVDRRAEADALIPFAFTTLDASTSSWPTGSCRRNRWRGRSTPWTRHVVLD